jgi:hypothetical protein
MAYLSLFLRSAAPCASPPPWPSLFQIILFLSTTLLTEMTVISLHKQCLIFHCSGVQFANGSLMKAASDHRNLSSLTRSSMLDSYKVYVGSEGFVDSCNPV